MKTNLETKARHDQKYPELEVGDIVGTIKKRERNFKRNAPEATKKALER